MIRIIVVSPVFRSSFRFLFFCLIISKRSPKRTADMSNNTVSMLTYMHAPSIDR